MKRYAVLLLFVCAPALADERIELLNAALTACQQQTQDANARALERIASISVELSSFLKCV